LHLSGDFPVDRDDGLGRGRTASFAAIFVLDIDPQPEISSLRDGRY